MLYYTIPYHTITYYTILYTIYYILYDTIRYYTILYYTILYYTILYYTILYYTSCAGERGLVSLGGLLHLHLGAGSQGPHSGTPTPNIRFNRLNTFKLQ